MDREASAKGIFTNNRCFAGWSSLQSPSSWSHYCIFFHYSFIFISSILVRCQFKNGYESEVCLEFTMSQWKYLTCDNSVQLLFPNMRIQSFPKLFPNPQLRWWYSGKMCHFNPIACIKLHIRVSNKQLKTLLRFSRNFISSKFLLLCQWWRWCVRSCLVLRCGDTVSCCHELRWLWPGACLLPLFLMWWWQWWLTIKY